MGRRFSIDDVELTETSEGTMVTVDRGGRNGERDAVLLKDVFGLESASLADEDWIVA